MAVNKYLPHLLVLPEDEANKDIADGFLLNHNINQRNIQVLNVAGGCEKVKEKFKREKFYEMDKYQHRRVLLLVDFDNDVSRITEIKAEIPHGLQDRIFVLGVLSEPEKLKGLNGLHSFEKIGKLLAEHCVDEDYSLWADRLLQHNQPELQRLISDVRPFVI